MRNKVLFFLAIIGLVAGLVSAYIFGIEKKPQPPVFNPASNPYGKGIYANGIIESYQTNGENINIYPEVSGIITRILVAEGQSVRQGTPLLMIEDSVQRATVAQQKSQAEAALALLEELKAMPRKENLEVAKAQVDFASASLKNAQDQLDKQRQSYALNPKSVSKIDLDNAENAVHVAKANLEVARRQYELTKAGAWIYDIRNQEKQHQALTKAYMASDALLAKYIIRAPSDGVILSINAAVGSYISPQGTYDTYTQGSTPVFVMGSAQAYGGVRCYIDEILVHRLPTPARLKSKMFIRGTDISIPLEYVRVQPYVSPKIQLSNQRTERVDVRVLPVIFRFQKPGNFSLYPGQLVDVYIGEE
ncbi:HlyD family secretion protein [Geotalea uraniireducens]|uniref:Secretion protein HlyD family protein n=1 Tax=Geotalea uraniireducens (strain Rf4) TaxID=351605 RepID=A5GAA8_GEOUR|nr:biotin/lipoyl-binding protein [Geotalea uraniireducens]ABQ25496.1 secretion protein HlyD family protein [Geotalea uraniireducens Rf4]